MKMQTGLVQITLAPVDGDLRLRRLLCGKASPFRGARLPHNSLRAGWKAQPSSRRGGGRMLRGPESQRLSAQQAAEPRAELGIVGEFGQPWMQAPARRETNPRVWRTPRLLRALMVAAQLAVLLPAFAGWAAGQDNAAITPPQLRGVGIAQRLNEQVPLDLSFRDETGQPVTLGSYFGKRPVILSLVYYTCPMLCTMAENGLLNALREVKFNIGEQYEVVTVSFDPSDKPELAMAKKGIYAGLYGRPGARHGWHFLVGDEPSIRALTEAVGFHYNYDPKTRQFAHATGIMVLTPQGKVSRYFYGIQYVPRDVRLALVEASIEKIGNPVDAVLLYCCQYDPVTGKYGIIVSRVLKIAGLVTLLALGAMIFALSRGRRHGGA